MAVNKDYIPRNIDAFHKWFKHLHEYVMKKTTGKGAEWHHILPDELKEFHTAFREWEKVYVGLLDSDSVNAPSKRTLAKKRATGVIRPFVKRHLHFKAVTDEEKIEMAIPVHDTTRTQKGPPQEKVDFSLMSKGPRMVGFPFKVLGAENRGKPYRYDGALFAWALLDHEPTCLSELTNRTLAPRSSLSLTFSEEDRGKKLYAAATWQNSGGTLGPWSNIQFTYVP